MADDSAQHDDSEWDAIIVGGGLGGLTAAAYLAADGRRVLVLEQHDVAGGNSHVFRRRRKYEFDVGVHYIGDCGADGIVPAILAGLGVADRVRFREMDPKCFDKVVVPDVAVDVPADWDEYLARLQNALPGDEAGLATFVEIIKAMGDEQRAALLAPADVEVTDVIAMTPTVRDWGRRPLAELFDHCDLSAKARTVLAAQSPNYGMAPDEATVSIHSIVTDHYIRGAYFPEGGGQTLAATLVEVIEANGGTLLTKVTVNKIDVTDGAVTGVRTTRGKAYRAPLVISNADYRRTVLDLVGDEHLSRTIIRRSRDAEMGLPFVTAYLGLKRELAVESSANIWWYDTTDIDDYYSRLRAGEQPEEVRFLFISFASLKDPDGANRPPGHTNLQLMTLCPPTYTPWGVDAGPADGVRYRKLPEYLAEKERFTDAMLRAAERVLGPLREDIVHLELATPLSQERYTLSSGGTPFGVARWGRSGSRPDTTTSVRGLHIVGQSTRYGSGITGVMVGGIACASQILDRALMHEVHSGAVVGDPSVLGERAADWDPLRISRGEQRRDARGLAQIAHHARKARSIS